MQRNSFFVALLCELEHFGLHSQNVKTAAGSFHVMAHAPRLSIMDFGMLGCTGTVHLGESARTAECVENIKGLSVATRRQAKDMPAHTDTRATPHISTIAVHVI